MVGWKHYNRNVLESVGVTLVKTPVMEDTWSELAIFPSVHGWTEVHSIELMSGEFSVNL